jgi:hypothetical protein
MRNSPMCAREYGVCTQVCGNQEAGSVSARTAKADARHETRATPELT